MKHVIIGTAGHVDHGKTVLVKALTGTLTEGPVRVGDAVEIGRASCRGRV